jgi:hypothetical protein
MLSLDSVENRHLASQQMHVEGRKRGRLYNSGVVDSHLATLVLEFQGEVTDHMQEAR